ncbi:MAG TPA: ferritin-like protein [Chloroflexia bacterium]|nr:ferritin-like protein [Chloroflexia bacterium]
MIKIRPELVAALDTGDGLQAALQQAVMLEHATIPAYLYAMYSIKTGSNSAIENLISSVVIEEMLHMALACNILNAIGGSPVIDMPGFIPDYPSPLPGSVDEGLIVPLAPFSLDLVKNVFMEIEEPEDPLDFPVGAVAAPPTFITIGMFYNMIKEKLKLAGPGIWVGDQSKQVTDLNMPDLTEVYDFDTAAAAIDLIVEQGEGTTTDPMEPDSNTEPAHYYRYAEIYYGKTLIANPNPPPNPTPEQKYIYGGAPIPFDPTGVYPTVENPKAANYPPGSKARYACDTFNYTYTSLLKSLHSTFNGNRNQLGTAVGLMESLKEQVVDLMAIDLGNGFTAGPSFEYQPVNP